MSKSISKTINIYKFTYHLLDIDECADPELSWDCTAGCKNLNGTYKCLPSLVGRVEPTDGDGFSPGEIVCKSGFKLSDDGSECQDINECDLADIDSDSWRMTYRYCEHKCENTVGSYICHCPQGYHLLEDQNSLFWMAPNYRHRKTRLSVRKHQERIYALCLRDQPTERLLAISISKMASTTLVAILPATRVISCRAHNLRFVDTPDFGLVQKPSAWVSTHQCTMYKQFKLVL